MTLPLLMMMGASGQQDIDWSNWDELNEADLASDDIFVCLFENTSASGNETGQGGGLSGANLVLTQSGSVAGATGSPPKRTLDGSDDCFSMTTAAVDALICNANKTWTIVFKVDSLPDDAQTTDFFVFSSADGNELLRAYESAEFLYFDTEQDNTDEIQNTTGKFAISTTYYVAFWADGTDMRAGFTTTKPTKWSDFASSDRVLFSTNTGDHSGESFDANTWLFTYVNGWNWLEGNAHYIVMAKTCLIDNAA